MLTISEVFINWKRQDILIQDFKKINFCNDISLESELIIN
jgi:hypothetical protein